MEADVGAVDPFSGTTVEPPSVTPEAGEWYQRLPNEPKFRVVERDWILPVHKVWAEHRLNHKDKEGKPAPLEPPFYVQDKKGVFGWVPWPGSIIAWPRELAWIMDLFDEGKTVSDLRPAGKKKQ